MDCEVLVQKKNDNNVLIPHACKSCHYVETEELQLKLKPYYTKGISILKENEVVADKEIGNVQEVKPPQGSTFVVENVENLEIHGKQRGVQLSKEFLTDLCQKCYAINECKIYLKKKEANENEFASKV